MIYSLKKKVNLSFLAHQKYIMVSIKTLLKQIRNTNSDNDRASYINGKKFGETLSYNKINDGYSVLIIRLSLAYGAGPGLTDKRVLNDFILKALKEKNKYA